VRAGIRYVRYAPMLQAAFVRTLIFTLFVSAVWALLALVAVTICARAPWDTAF